MALPKPSTGGLFGNLDAGAPAPTGGSGLFAGILTPTPAALPEIGNLFAVAGAGT